MTKLQIFANISDKPNTQTPLSVRQHQPCPSGVNQINLPTPLLTWQSPPLPPPTSPRLHLPAAAAAAAVYDGEADLRAAAAGGPGARARRGRAAALRRRQRPGLPGPRAGAGAHPVRPRPVQPHLLHPGLRARGRRPHRPLRAAEEAARVHPPVRPRRRARVPGPASDPISPLLCSVVLPIPPGRSHPQGANLVCYPVSQKL